MNPLGFAGQSPPSSASAVGRYHRHLREVKEELQKSVSRGRLSVRLDDVSVATLLGRQPIRLAPESRASLIGKESAENQNAILAAVMVMIVVIMICNDLASG